MNGRCRKACFLLLVLTGCSHRELSRQKVVSALLPGISITEIQEFTYALDSTRSGYQILAKVVLCNGHSMYGLTNGGVTARLVVDRAGRETHIRTDSGGLTIDEKLQRALPVQIRLELEHQLQCQSAMVMTKNGQNSWTHSYFHIWLIPEQTTNTLYLIGYGN